MILFIIVIRVASDVRPALRSTILALDPSNCGNEDVVFSQTVLFNGLFLRNYTGAEQQKGNEGWGLWDEKPDNLVSARMAGGPGFSPQERFAPALQQAPFAVLSFAFRSDALLKRHRLPAR
jgi:hypothetical protein